MNELDRPNFSLVFTLLQFYHYTDREGYISIAWEKCIRMSRPGVKYGAGVYLTTRDPDNGSNNTKKSIARDIYGGWRKSYSGKKPSILQ